MQMRVNERRPVETEQHQVNDGSALESGVFCRWYRSRASKPDEHAVAAAD